MAALARVERGLATVGALALAVLLLTGVWLTRYYRPSPGLGELAHRYPGIAIAIGVHRAAAGTLLLAAGVLLGVRVATAVRRAAPAALAVLATVALVVTGRRLAWDALALWAVTVNSDVSGMLFAAFDPRVRFVLRAGTGEISPATFRLGLGAHTLALPAVLAVALWWAYRARESPTAPGT